jgi:hypothetical protein
MKSFLCSYPAPFKTRYRAIPQGLLAWVAALGIAFGPLVAVAVTAPTPMSTLETALQGRAVNMLQKEVPAGEVIATRDLTNGALAILAAGGSPAQAQQLLALAFSVQNMDVSSPTYGSFPWYYNSSAVTDPNTDVFTSQALGPIWLHYGQLFPASFQAQMRTHLQATTSALVRRKAGVSYTNIYLMDAISLLLIGQSLGDGASIQTGTVAIQQWNTYTQAGGIFEYGTSDYYSIDLDSLVMGYLYCNNPSLHSMFQSILDYFWTDIKANYFYGTQDLSGAHSRDYDFLYGRAGLLYYFWTEGKNNWFTTDLNLVEMGQVYVLENGLSSAGYHPNWNALPGVSDASPKWIVQSNSTALNSDRANWVTADFALGSASANYGPQDKLINLELNTNKPLFPDITVVPDVYDAPYGMRVEPDSQGHLKPDHQPLNPASVQKGGMLLTVLDLDPALAGNVSNFASNIVLPANADSISVDGTNVNLTTPTKIPVTTHSWIGIREGQSAVLIRLFRVDALGATAPVIVLQSDANGLGYGAARLTAYHYQGNAAAPATLSATHLKVGILIIAYNCPNDAEWNSLLADARASQIIETEPNGTWQVQVQVAGPEGGYLQIARNLTNRLSFTRTGAGHP